MVWKSQRGHLGDPAFSTRTIQCFGEALFECKLTVTLVQIPIGYGKSTSTNQEPSLVCVVSRVYLLNLNSKHFVCLSRVFFAESDSGVKVFKKKATWGNPQQNFGCSLQLVKKIDKNKAQ